MRDPVRAGEAPFVTTIAHTQADPRTEPLTAFSETSSLDPMERIAAQGRMMRDAKSRLRDPRTPRHIRWLIRGMGALLVAPFVLPAIIELVDWIR